MTTVAEVAPDVYRISTYVPEADLEFGQFLVADDEPLLFHTGMRVLFPAVQAAIATVLDPASIRWIGFSHFEADECGALNEWLALAPQAQAICSLVGAIVSVNDFATRPARPLMDGETLATGKRRFRFMQTPHVPHCWEAGMLFEETQSILLCSDLFTRNGKGDAVTESDMVGPTKASLVEYQKGPFAHYFPYTPNTRAIFDRLAALEPRTLATMHGPTFHGDGRRALQDLLTMYGDVLGNSA